MPPIIIPFNDIKKSVIPKIVEEYLTQEQWTKIHRGLKDDVISSQASACKMEICLCVFCFFPCGFLCHPCNTATFYRAKAHSSLHNINVDLFDGKQVLSFSEKGHILLDPHQIIPLSATIAETMSTHHHHHHHDNGDKKMIINDAKTVIDDA